MFHIIYVIVSVLLWIILIYCAIYALFATWIGGIRAYDAYRKRRLGRKLADDVERYVKEKTNV